MTMLVGSRWDDANGQRCEQGINFQEVGTPKKTRNCKSFTSESVDGTSTVLDGSDSDSDSSSIATLRRRFSEVENSYTDDLVATGEQFQVELTSGEDACRLSGLYHECVAWIDLPAREAHPTIPIVRNRDCAIANEIGEDHQGDVIKRFPEVKIIVSNPQDVLYSMSRVLSKTVEISSSSMESASAPEESSKLEMTCPPLKGLFNDGLLNVTFDVEELATLARSGPANAELARAVGRRVAGESLEVDITHIQIDTDWENIHYYLNAVFDPITMQEEEPKTIMLGGVVKK